MSVAEFSAIERYPTVAYQRRQVILLTLRRLGAYRDSDGWPMNVILPHLRAEHRTGGWPQARRQRGARQDPYDVGTRQHLRALQAQGLVEEVDGHPIRWRLTEARPAVQPADIGWAPITPRKGLWACVKCMMIGYEIPAQAHALEENHELLEIPAHLVDAVLQAWGENRREAVAAIVRLAAETEADGE